jgi:hypothetical protein
MTCLHTLFVFQVMARGDLRALALAHRQLTAAMAAQQQLRAQRQAQAARCGSTEHSYI